MFVISLHPFEIHLYCSPVDTTEDIHLENQALLIRLPKAMKKTGFGKAGTYRRIIANRFPPTNKDGIRYHSLFNRHNIREDTKKKKKKKKK
ncbi:hypothetical protein, partial [Escherichia coli]|uniref:hypothetical protein n=1 Tax=Escherichia coli TaxID=562 RepID=UPI00207B6AD8